MLMDIYKRLYTRFGAQGWWPGHTRFEIIIGAILTQNTNWTNVEKAITNLRAANCLDSKTLYQINLEKLAELIRPAGYYNLKAKRLKNFVDWLYENFNGDADDPARMSTAELREQLLTVKGIGRETADSILLYAFNKTAFVVDAYTARIVVRHRLIDADADYEQLKEFFENNLPCDVRLFNEFHALLVRLGKEYCRTRPRCTGCPLQNLPHDTD
ncbi:MAG: endonuclease III domain-containing protein [Planctomycetota bacterium]